VRAEHVERLLGISSNNGPLRGELTQQKQQLLSLWHIQQKYTQKSQDCVTYLKVKSSGILDSWNMTKSFVALVSFHQTKLEIMLGGKRTLEGKPFRMLRCCIFAVIKCFYRLCLISLSKSFH